MADTKKKKLPKMYYAQDADKYLMRDGDVTSEDAADPLESADYAENESTEPTGLVSKTARMRKKGMPGGRR